MKIEVQTEIKTEVNKEMELEWWTGMQVDIKYCQKLRMARNTDK